MESTKTLGVLIVGYIIGFVLGALLLLMWVSNERISCLPAQAAYYEAAADWYRGKLAMEQDDFAYYKQYREGNR